MAFGVRPIKIPIVGVDQFSKTFGSIGKKLQKAGQNLTNVGSAVTRNVTLPVVAAGAAILATAGGFEASMNQVGVLINDTQVPFEQLTERARELGATTQFSASQAAEAMTFLAMAGLDSKEVFDALPGTLQLAAAAGTDLGTAADIATNIMTPFGLKASELARINDTLANTFTRTNTNMLQLAEGMKFVAPVASSMGIELEETAAAMGLLGNAGIQGAMAGTTLRGALSRLANPSREAVQTLSKLRIRKSDVIDSKGNIKSLTDMVRVFEQSGASAAELMQVFGQRAGPGMAALVRQGTQALVEQTEANKKQGTAQKVADARLKGFFGQLRKLRSAAEELAISIGEAGLLSAITKLAEKLTSLVAWFSRLDGPTKNFLVITGGIAAAIGPLLLGLGTFIKLVGFAAAGLAKMAPILSGIGGFFASWGPLITGVAAPLLLFLASLWAIINTIVLLVKHWDTWMFMLESKFNWLQTWSFFLADMSKSIGNIVKFIPFIGKGLSEEFETAAKGFELEAEQRASQDVATRAAAERAARQAGEAGFTQTNNSEVLVKVLSEGVPIRAQRQSGDNVTLQTNTGLAFAGG